MATKLTKKRHDTLVKMARLGHYDCTAARFSGVDPSTLKHWLRKGKEQTEGIYFEFAEAYELAKAQGETRLLSEITNAVEAGDWRAAAWILERKYPARWSKQNRVEVTGKDGGPLQMQPVNEKAVIDAYQARIEAAKVETSELFE